MAKGTGKRVRLQQGEYWCPDCADLRLIGADVCDPSGRVLEADHEWDGNDMRCLACEAVVRDWVTEAEALKVQFIRWHDDCRKRNVIGPSPGGAAGQLGVSRARVYSLVEAGVLERNDCPVPGYEVTYISQRSIEARKREVERMRADGNDPELGGRPWHRK